MTAWYTRKFSPSDATKQALGEFDKFPKVVLKSFAEISVNQIRNRILRFPNGPINNYLGNKVGIQATLENAEICNELILANSDTPPDFERGPTGSTRHKISSLQNPWKTKRVRIISNPNSGQDNLGLLTNGTVGASGATGDIGELAEPSGKLWCEVVNNSGNTGWQVISLTRNRWPLTREACPMLSTCENTQLFDIRF